MRLLLDTHIALWAIADSPRLPGQARMLILAPENEIVVSAASVWEISIKHGLAKKKMPVSGAAVKIWFEQAGYTLLPVTAEHAALVEELPAHHADPFDRMLVAQALAEPLRLVTSDVQVARYSDTVILVLTDQGGLVPAAQATREATREATPQRRARAFSATRANRRKARASSSS